MTLSFSQLLLGLVLFFFLWVVLDWLWVCWRDGRARRRAQKRFRECHLCGKVYPENPGVKLSDCPDCAAANTKRGHRRLA